MPSTVSDRVRDILSRAVIDGHHVRIPEQLDRRDYVEVNKVLTTLGGLWKRQAKAHVFLRDPAPAIAGVIGGQVLAAVPAPQRDEGYVATPAKLAADILYMHSEIGQLEPGARVLEPSAGDGQLVRAILDADPAVHVTAIEPNAARASGIPTGPNVTLHTVRFEEYDHGGELFDAVVMNPPFSVPGNRTIWIDHVQRAFRLLKPGGVLTAIVPGGFEFRQDRRHEAMRELVGACGSWRRLPDGSFKESGTDVRTVVLMLERHAWAANHPAPLPPEPAERPAAPVLQLARPVVAPRPAPRLTASATRGSQLALF